MRIIASTARPTSTRAWYGRHARWAVVRLDVAQRGGATRRLGLGRPRWRAHSLARVHAVGQGEQRVRLLGCTCLHLCERRRRGHGGDTKSTARARRRHRDESSTSRFRRGGVQGRSGRKVRPWGSMARRTHVRRCVGVRGDGTAERRTRSQIGEAGARPLGCVRMCACRSPTARPWQRHEIDGVH
jgi:hypothetical protein